MQFIVMILVTFTLCGCVPLGPGKNDFVIDLCNDYALARASNDVVWIHKTGAHIEGKFARIDSKVTSIGWDKRYILAERQPLDGNNKPIANKFDYWIIDTELNTRYGPLTKDEFNAKISGMETKAKLQDVYSYKQKLPNQSPTASP